MSLIPRQFHAVEEKVVLEGNSPLPYLGQLLCSRCALQQAAGCWLRANGCRRGEESGEPRLLREKGQRQEPAEPRIW